MTITLEHLKELKPYTIFAAGTGTYPELYSEEIRWVAVRGGIHDWAIYYHLPHFDKDYIAANGDKCHNESIIKRLVPCTDEAYAMYRR